MRVAVDAAPGTGLSMQLLRPRLRQLSLPKAEEGRQALGFGTRIWFQDQWHSFGSVQSSICLCVHSLWTAVPCQALRQGLRMQW